ncbi:hypothetical protein PTI98_007304 [Pleurotus ostreatus]|nr:hypothetical protein PTI98_007304 [Pleurotus ostreatus]
MNNGQFEFRFPGMHEDPQLVAGTGVPGTTVYFEPEDAGQGQIFTIPLWAGPQSNESILRQIKAYLRAQALPVKMHGLTADAAKGLMHELCMRKEKRLARKAIGMRDKERRRSGEWVVTHLSGPGVAPLPDDDTTVTASNNTNGTGVVEKWVYHAEPQMPIADVAHKIANHLGLRKRSLLSREAWNAEHIREANGSDKSDKSGAKRAREAAEESDDCRDAGEEDGPPTKRPRPVEDETQA